MGWDPATISCVIALVLAPCTAGADWAMASGTSARAIDPPCAGGECRAAADRKKYKTKQVWKKARKVVSEHDKSNFRRKTA